MGFSSPADPLAFSTAKWSGVSPNWLVMFTWQWCTLVKLVVVVVVVVLVCVCEGGGVVAVAVVHIDQVDAKKPIIQSVLPLLHI